MSPEVSLEPVLAWPWVAVCAVVALATVTAGARGLGWVVRVRRSAIAVLVAAGLLGPHAGATSTTVTGRPDFEVVVALDRTASMAVRDAGPTSRLEQAVADITDLGTSLDAPVTVVTWGADVRQPVPATTDDDFLAASLGALQPEPPAIGAGSRIDRPLDTLRVLLARSSREHPDRSLVLVLLSDGENTDAGRERSFDALADQLARGLVVGYGTATGGPVPLSPDRADVFVPAPEGSGPAVSRRSEGRLTEVAGQLGATYRNREDLTSMAAAEELVEPDPVRRATSEPADVTWIVALALLALLVPELRIAVRQWREVHSMRKVRP